MSRDQAIIVTGASRGIGGAIAGALLRNGFVVGCLSRSGELPADIAGDADLRARCLAIAADMSDPPAVTAGMARMAQIAPLAGLVNNAGVHEEADSAQLSLDSWQRMIDGNATTALIGCQAAYPHLQTNGGLIVNIGSFYDRIGVRRSLGYCAAKAAVGALTRVLAAEWAGDGIRVVNVAPGYIETELNRAEMTSGPLRNFLEKRIPRRQPGRADEIASFVAGLFAMGSTFLTGETIYVDGGQGIAL